MNPTVTSSVDSSSSSTLLKSHSKPQSSSEEGEGFLSSLKSALVGCDGSESAKEGGKVSAKSGTEEAKSASTDEISSDGDSESVKTQGTAASSALTDELLEGSEEESVSEVEGSTKTGRAEGDESADPVDDEANSKLAAKDQADKALLANQSLQESGSEETKASVKTQASAQQAMDEGSELLGRLEEANQSLRRGDSSTVTTTQATTTTSEQAPVLQSSQATIPQTSGVASEEAVEGALKSEQLAAAGSAKLMTGVSQEQQKYSQIQWEGAESSSSLPSGGQPTPNSVGASQLSGQQQANELAAVGAAASMQNSADAETIDPKLAQVTYSEAELEGLTEEELVALASAQGGVAHSQSSQTTGASSQTHTSAANIAAGSAVSQAMLNQQAQTQTANAALNSAQVTQEGQQAAINANGLAANLTSAAQATNSSKQAAQITAALGLGKLASSKSDSKAAASEQRLDQQLAGLAMQQGVNGIQAKAEAQQVAANSPLVLNREAAGEQMAERVQMMLAKNLKSVDIRLDPPELGRMQIRMTMNNDVASVQFTVANQQSRDIVEQAMPRLREMLTQQGIQLADTSVQQQSNGQQQQGQLASGSGGSGRGSSMGEDGTLENNDESVNLEMNITEKGDGISFYA